jgi:hypothetical protein
MEPVADRTAHDRAPERVLWLLALVCVGLTLVAHRPDADDAFYVSLAVTAADRPDWPLMSSEPTLGLDDLPLHLAAYRVQSYEVWNAALSWLTGISAIRCFHQISASIAALWMPLALAGLFRILVPRRWLWATAATVIVLVAAGDVHRWYGNFSLVRLWQGKAIFVSACLPAIFTHALRFARQPTLSRGLLLTAGQVAAVGLTASALWAAPCAAGAAAVAARPHLEDLRVLGLSLLSSVPNLALAGWVKRSLADQVQAWQSDPSPLWAASFSAWPPGHLLGEALSTVLGEGVLRAAALLSLLVTWTVCRRGLCQRFVVIVPLLVSGTLLNPWAARWVTSNLTGPGYWRALWVLPIPILMALALTSPLELDPPSLGLVRRLATGLLLAAFALFVPALGGLSEDNDVRLQAPGLKVPEGAFRWAEMLNRSVPPGAVVVAPPEVALWVPTFHRPARPLSVRRYTRRLEAHLGPAEAARRDLLTQLVAGARGPGDSAELAAGLAHYRVGAVCLGASGRRAELRRLLGSSGFSLYRMGLDYELWVRTAGSRMRSVPIEGLVSPTER